MVRLAGAGEDEGEGAKFAVSETVREVGIFVAGLMLGAAAGVFWAGLFFAEKIGEFGGDYEDKEDEGDAGN